MNRILVLDGYGTVGIHAVAALVSHLRTTDVAAAGRNPHRAPGRRCQPQGEPQRYPEGGQIGGQPGADAPGGAREQQPHGRR